MTYKGKASYGSLPLSIYNSKASCIWLEYLYVTRISNIYMWLEWFIWIWIEYLYLTRIFIFDPSVRIGFEHLYVTWVFIFDSNIHIWCKYLYLTRMLIFGSNLHNWLKYLHLTRIIVFDSNIDIWPEIYIRLEYVYVMWLECFVWTQYDSYEHVYLTRYISYEHDVFDSNALCVYFKMAKSHRMLLISQNCFHNWILLTCKICYAVIFCKSYAANDPNNQCLVIIIIMIYVCKYIYMYMYIYIYNNNNDMYM